MVRQNMSTLPCTTSVHSYVQEVHLIPFFSYVKKLIPFSMDNIGMIFLNLIFTGMNNFVNI